MRALGSGLVTMLSIWILTGCPGKENYLRPPKAPESLVGPPVNDARFDKPVAYPADAMKSQKGKSFDPNDPNAQQQMPAMGMGGMGSGSGSGGGFVPGSR